MIQYVETLRYDVLKYYFAVININNGNNRNIYIYDDESEDTPE